MRARAWGKATVPKEQEKRWPLINDKVARKLDALDSRYYEGTENVGELLEAFARETELVKNANNVINSDRIKLRFDPLYASGYGWRYASRIHK